MTVRAPDFTIGQNDLLEPIFHDLIDSLDQPIDLTTAVNLEFHMVNVNTHVVKIASGTAVTIPSDDNNRIQYNWQSGDTDTPGLYFGEWQFEKGGKVETVPNGPIEDKILIEITPEIA